MLRTVFLDAVLKRTWLGAARRRMQPPLNPAAYPVELHSVATIRLKEMFYLESRVFTECAPLAYKRLVTRLGEPGQQQEAPPDWRFATWVCAALVLTQIDVRLVCAMPRKWCTSATPSVY